MSDELSFNIALAVLAACPESLSRAQTKLIEEQLAKSDYYGMRSQNETEDASQREQELEQAVYALCDLIGQMFEFREKALSLRNPNLVTNHLAYHYPSVGSALRQVIAKLGKRVRQSGVIYSALPRLLFSGMRPEEWGVKPHSELVREEFEFCADYWMRELGVPSKDDEFAELLSRDGPANGIE